MARIKKNRVIKKHFAIMLSTIISVFFGSIWILSLTVAIKALKLLMRFPAELFDLKTLFLFTLLTFAIVVMFNISLKLFSETVEDLYKLLVSK